MASELKTKEETSMPASKPKIGVIGIGFGAQVYIPGLQSEGWEVAALCSRNREKATKIADVRRNPECAHRPAGADPAGRYRRRRDCDAAGRPP